MIKLGTFFSGIGAVEKALKNIDIEYDLQFFSEIDKYAIKSYTAIHNETEDKNVGDISNLKGEDLPYCDIWFGGFPCQDISVAGKLAGWEENTRSSLGWEMIRLAREVENKPKYILFENVKNITSKRFKETLELFKQDLEDLGYTLYDKVLNAKNYGIPQNRERYFLIASLGGQNYSFPEPIELKLKLKDMLEDEVDEKYYLTESNIKTINRNFGSKGKVLNLNEFSLIEKMTYPSRINQKINETIVPTLTSAMGTGGGNVPVITIDYSIKPSVAKNFEREKELIAKSDKEIYQAKADSGWQDNKVGLKVSPALRAGNNHTSALDKSLTIRKLTPKECFRLMGFSDEDFNKASQVNSNSQLYKQAGNSIVVNVLERILEGLVNNES